MISTNVASVNTMHNSNEQLSWRCLARRGMLFSECESIDFLRLPPGVTYELSGRAGAAGAWVVLSGTGMLNHESDGGGLMLRDRNVVVFDHEDNPSLKAGPGGIEFIWVAVNPFALTEKMSRRKPQL